MPLICVLWIWLQEVLKQTKNIQMSTKERYLINFICTVDTPVLWLQKDILNFFYIRPYVDSIRTILYVHFWSQHLHWSNSISKMLSIINEPCMEHDVLSESYYLLLFYLMHISSLSNTYKWCKYIFYNPKALLPNISTKTDFHWKSCKNAIMRGYLQCYIQ